MTIRYADLDSDRFVIAFYSSDLHGTDRIPVSAVPITDDVHAALLAGQSAGKRMKVLESGKAKLVDLPAPTKNELAASLRAQRTVALVNSDWLVARHQDEVLAGDATTLSSEQFKALSAYRKALRDLSKADGFPAVDLPAAPDFIGV
jgi:hypothetical protein